MITQLFIPSFVGNYAVLQQRIVGCEVNKYELRAAVVVARGYKRTIENYFTVLIDQNNVLPFPDRLEKAFNELRELVGHHDLLHIVLPGSLIIYKEIFVPFVDAHKIKKIIPFEVEPLLPFAIHDVYIDSMILDSFEGQSRVLVAACRKEQADEYTQAAQRANLKVHKVTADLFEWIAFVRAIPEYKAIMEPFAIIDLDIYSTNILIMQHGQLVASRFIPRGILQAPLSAKTGEEITPDYVTRYGLQDDRIKKSIDSLIQDIRLTIDSSLEKENIESLSRIFIAGFGYDISSIVEHFTNYLQIPVEKFYAHKIIHNGTISSRQQQGVPGGFEVALGAALLLPETQDTNLNKWVAAYEEQKLMTGRIITSLILAGLIILTLGIYSFFSIRSLYKESYQSEQEAIASLKKVFTLRKTGSLQTTLNAARQELAKEKTIWFALSTGNRFSFLTYLQELSTRIDREGLGLDLKRLTIKSGEGNEDVLTLEGTVNGYDALRSFEESLAASQLFTNIPKLQETKFTLTLFIEKKTSE